MDTINLIVSKNIKQARQEKDLSLDELARLSGPRLNGVAATLL